MELNAEQKLVLQKIEGPVLVFAGPGSGKTRTMVERVDNMVKVGINPENILCLTFTIKAAEEMRNRLFKRGVNVASMLVTTFHAFALRMIQKYDKTSYGVLDEDESYFFMEEVSKRLNLELNSSTYQEIIKVKDSMSTIKEVENRIKTKRDKEKLEIFKAYQKGLEKEKLMDYSDMLLKFYKLICDDENILVDIQDKYKYISVDECQDNNKIQYLIIKTIASKHQNIMMIGDQKQSIYRFRAARPENILDFMKDFPEYKLLNLVTNYRSDKNIVEHANKLIKNNKLLPGDTLCQANSEEPGEINVHFDKDMFSSANAVFSLCQGEKDIAILCRTRADISLLYKVFIEKGINIFSNKKKGTNITHQKNLAAAISNPNGANLIRLIKKSVDKASLNSITEAIAELNNLDDIVSKINSLPIPPKNKLLIEENVSKIKSYLYMDFGNQKSTFINQEIFPKITSYEKGILSSPKNVNAVLSDLELNLLSAIDMIQELLADNEEEGAIKVMTAHGSKGLEFDTVVIFNASEGVYPHGMNTSDEDGMEEERRLFFVAMTRAKKKLHIMMQGEKEKSRFIGEAGLDGSNHVFTPKTKTRYGGQR